MADDTDALKQVATAVEQSDFTDEDVEELRVLLGKLEGELDVYTDLGDLFSLGGRGYKRVIRAPDGVGSIRRYLHWREEQREQLAEGEDSLEGTEFEVGFGRLSDRDEAFFDCPLCGDEVFNTRVGKHPFSKHWEEIGKLAEQRDGE